MYQDTDAGLNGMSLIYNPGEMELAQKEFREFVVLFGDNQESNSFLAMENVAEFTPDVPFANYTSEYPIPSMNQSFWYPAMVNSPKTNITTDVAANFFPVCSYLLHIERFCYKLMSHTSLAQRLDLWKWSLL